ncbi:hypothetical protein ACH36K_02095 [Clostridium sp. MB05]
MKAYKIAKYNINSLKKSLFVYYLIFIAVCMFLVTLSKIYYGNFGTSGIELSSAIFIFIVGLNMFKENFYFMKSNNVSRKSYFLGTVLSILPIATLMSVIDIIINRVYSLFSKCPTNYDMIFTDFSNNVDITTATSNWIQGNDIVTLFNTFLFQAALYLMLFALGFVITMVYYKCNKLMKTVISISPIMLFILFGALVSIFPYAAQKVLEFLFYIFGITPRNVYTAILTFIILFIALIIAAYLLIRKMIIKEK